MMLIAPSTHVPAVAANDHHSWVVPGPKLTAAFRFDVVTLAVGELPEPEGLAV